MVEQKFSRTASILLWSILIIFGTACSQEQKTVKIPPLGRQQSVSNVPPVVDSPTISVKETPLVEPKRAESKPVENEKEVVEPTSFEMALDKAAGGFSISQSAQSPSDWKLVAHHYQDAINLMETVKPQTRYYPIAKAKVREYQRHVDYALEKSVPPTRTLREPEPPKIVVSVPPLKDSISSPQKMQLPRAVQKILEENLQPQEVAAAPQELNSPPQSLQLPPTTPIPQSSPTPPQAIPIPIQTKKEVYAAVPIQKDSRQAMVFTAPIKRRIGGTPIIDVTFNGKRRFEMIVDTGASGTVITQQMASLLRVSTVGKAKANTASAQSVEFPIGYVDSIEAGGVKVKKVAVAIAPEQLKNGLLGHDFFGNYDITIKSNVVEFRPRPNNYQVRQQQETRKSIPIYPKKLYEE